MINQILSAVSRLKVSRFDLNYLRPLQSDQVHSVTQFLRTSQEEIRRKRINAKLESSLNNQILKIASYTH
jgi:hypothetical protein